MEDPKFKEKKTRKVAMSQWLDVSILYGMSDRRRLLTFIVNAILIVGIPRLAGLSWDDKNFTWVAGWILIGNSILIDLSMATGKRCSETSEKEKKDGRPKIDEN